VKNKVRLPPYTLPLHPCWRGFLTSWSKVVQRSRDVKCILLPRGLKQQLISYYVDNTTFIIRGEEKIIHNMVNLLEVFLSISGLELNWDKFLASWSYERYKEKPSWAQNF
jgi:hypothetical protein